MPGPEAPQPLTADVPWPGSAPYGEADRAFFHGRRRETDELRALLERDTLTLLIGPAKVGKTSLIRAGLLPSLSPDWLPVPITIDWTAANDQRPLSRQVLEAVEAAGLARGLEGPKVNANDTLWEAFHRDGARWWNARQRVVTPVIVLDQFEQAFAAGDTNATTRRHRDRLLEELSQLICNRPPSRVGSRLEDGSEAEGAFDFGTAPIRVLIVADESTAPKLGALRDLFPKLGRSELRLTAFTENQARDIFTRASAQRGLFAEAAIDQLLPLLAKGNERETPIPPLTLSTRARELAEQRIKLNEPQITTAFFTPQPQAQPTSTPPPPPAAPPAARRSVAVPVAIVLIAFAAGVWDRQAASLSSDVVLDDVEEEGEGGEDLDSFAGDLENLLEEEAEEGKAESRWKLKEAMRGAGYGAGRQRTLEAQRAEELEDEEAEAAELRRMLMEGGGGQMDGLVNKLGDRGEGCQASREGILKLSPVYSGSLRPRTSDTRS